MKRKSNISKVRQMIKLVTQDQKYIKGPKSQGGEQTYIVKSKKSGQVRPVTISYFEDNKELYEPATHEQVKNFAKSLGNDISNQKNKDKKPTTKPEQKKLKKNEVQAMIKDIKPEYLDSDKTVQMSNKLKQAGHDEPKSFNGVFPESLQTIINSYINLGNEQYTRITNAGGPPGDPKGTSTITQLFSMAVPFVKAQNEQEFVKSIIQKLGDKELLQDIPVTTGIKFPSDVDKSMKGAYTKLAIAYRSGIAKRNRLKSIVEDLKNQNVIQGEPKYMQLWGDKDSKRIIISTVLNSKGRILLPNGKQVKDKNLVARWAQLGGGGQNPDDTTTLITMPNGDIIYKGWSDKTSTVDILSNTTIVSQFEELSKEIDTMQQLTDENKQKSKNIIKKTVQEIIQNENKLNTPVINTVKSSLTGIDDQTQFKYLSKLINDPKSTINTNIDKQIFSKNSVKKNVLEYLPEGSDASNLTWQQKYTAIRNMVGDTKSKKTSGMIKVMTKLFNQMAPEHSQVDIRKLYGKIRKNSRQIQRKSHEQLDLIHTKYEGKGLGSVLKAKQSIKILHLPFGSHGDYQQMHHATTVVCGKQGVQVGPKLIKHCLGVSSQDQFINRFSVQYRKQQMKDKQGNITGWVTYSQFLDSQTGKLIPIATNTYRPKQGVSSKTGQTKQWSKQMRRCFDKNKDIK